LFGSLIHQIEFLILENQREQCTTLLKDFHNVDNPRWLSPERMGKQPYNEAADTFAYGIICWEFIARDEPWSKVDFSVDIEAKILSGEREPIPSHCPNTFKEIIDSCWAQDQFSRPKFDWVLTMLEKLKHEDINSYENDAKQIIINQFEKSKKEAEDREKAKELEKIHLKKWFLLLDAVESHAKEDRSELHSSLSGLDLDKQRNLTVKMPGSRSDKGIMTKRNSQRKRLDTKKMSEKDTKHFTIL